MTKVFKGIFHEKTKDNNAWYVTLERKSCPSLPDTIRLRAVDNNGEFITSGAILDIDGKQGIRRHEGLTHALGLPMEEGLTLVKEFSY